MHDGYAYLEIANSLVFLGWALELMGYSDYPSSHHLCASLPCPSTRSIISDAIHVISSSGYFSFHIEEKVGSFRIWSRNPKKCFGISINVLTYCSSLLSQFILLIRPLLLSLFFILFILYSSSFLSH
ncbi:hypothetical protein BDZ91DRAFT_214184 [Kalaharituber pfeilii]|nr:hypothetical protein BDZ91DRAFT_214184 [Kalaharituber pfeilii]